jgi:hypothetical protein
MMLRHQADIAHAPIDTLEKVGGGGVRCTLVELFEQLIVPLRPQWQLPANIAPINTSRTSAGWRLPHVVELFKYLRCAAVPTLRMRPSTRWRVQAAVVCRCDAALQRALSLVSHPPADCESARLLSWAMAGAAKCVSWDNWACQGG